MNNIQNTARSPEATHSKIQSILLLVLDILVLHLKVCYHFLEDWYYKIFPKELEDVRGKIVLITGAAHGIGKETALQYGSLGAKVVTWDINEKGNAELVKEIQAQGGKAYAYKCDVTKREEIFEVAKKTQQEVGKVDILINNAGVMPAHPLLDHTEKEIRLIYDINVIAHLYILQAFLPDMIKDKKGHIVALSSCAGLYGLPNLVPYCGSKFAVRGIMLSLQEDLRTTNPDADIKFTTIYPYMVDTGLCKFPKMRFKQFSKLVTPAQAASAIIDAQRSGVKEISIPKRYLYLEMIMKFFPYKACVAFMDFIDSGVNSDLQ